MVPRATSRLSGERPAIDGEAAVAALVDAEALEEETVGGDGHDRVAGDEQPPELGVVAGQVVGVFPTGPPVLGAGGGSRPRAQQWPPGSTPAASLRMAVRVREAAVRRSSASRCVALGQVAFVGGLVLGVVAVVADDDVVEGLDGFAEPERLEKRGVERDPVARRFGASETARPPGVETMGAPAAVGEGQVHRESLAW